jgi:8-oxo-dGTP diphosphatase
MIEPYEHIETWKDKPWLPLPNEVALFGGVNLPPANLITSVHVLAFDGEKLLMVEHETRGWDLPGGHVEAGETLMQSLARELLEEAGAEVGEARVIGHWRCEVMAEKPENYNYPYPVSYLMLCLGDRVTLRDFEGRFETSNRDFFSPEKVRQLPWYSNNSAIYERALSELGLARESKNVQP